MWSDWGGGVGTTLIPQWSVMMTDLFEPMWFWPSPPPADHMVHQNFSFVWTTRFLCVAFLLSILGLVWRLLSLPHPVHNKAIGTFHFGPFWVLSKSCLLRERETSRTIPFSKKKGFAGESCLLYRPRPRTPTTIYNWNKIGFAICPFWVLSTSCAVNPPPPDPPITKGENRLFILCILVHIPKLSENY